MLAWWSSSVLKHVAGYPSWVWVWKRKDQQVCSSISEKKRTRGYIHCACLCSQKGWHKTKSQPCVVLLWAQLWLVLYTRSLTHAERWKFTSPYLVGHKITRIDIFHSSPPLTNRWWSFTFSASLIRFLTWVAVGGDGRYVRSYHPLESVNYLFVCEYWPYTRSRLIVYRHWDERCWK